MVADTDKMIRNVVRKICTERRKISLLKNKIGKLFQKKVTELVDVQNLWGHSKDVVLMACDGEK